MIKDRAYWEAWEARGPLRERESVVATLEILADRHLTTRMRKLAKRIDADVRAGKLHTMEQVFGLGEKRRHPR